MAQDTVDSGATAAPCECVSLPREEWDGVESDWSDIQFVRGSIPAVMGVPLRYDVVRRDLAARARDAGAEIPDGAMLLIGEGRFRRPVMLEVEGATAGARAIERPGGVAFTRFVPAPWGQMKARVAEFTDAVREAYGRPPDTFWAWYLTCGVCSQEREFETLLVAHMVAPR